MEKIYNIPFCVNMFFVFCSYTIFIIKSKLFKKDKSTHFIAQLLDLKGIYRLVFDKPFEPYFYAANKEWKVCFWIEPINYFLSQIYNWQALIQAILLNQFVKASMKSIRKNLLSWI